MKEAKEEERDYCKKEEAKEEGRDYCKKEEEGGQEGGQRPLLEGGQGGGEGLL